MIQGPRNVPNEQEKIRLFSNSLIKPTLLDKVLGVLDSGVVGVTIEVVKNTESGDLLPPRTANHVEDQVGPQLGLDLLPGLELAISV